MANIDDNINIESKDASLGGIVESGSNDKGNWIKFYDGTMICHGIITINTSLSTQADGWYFNTMQIVYPQKFSNTPTGSGTVCRRQGLYGFMFLSGSRESFYGHIFSSKSEENITISFNYMVIGRWK